MDPECTGHLLAFVRMSEWKNVRLVTMSDVRMFQPKTIYTASLHKLADNTNVVITVYLGDNFIFDRPPQCHVAVASFNHRLIHHLS